MTLDTSWKATMNLNCFLVVAVSIATLKLSQAEEQQDFYSPSHEMTNVTSSSSMKTVIGNKREDDTKTLQKIATVTPDLLSPISDPMVYQEINKSSVPKKEADPSKLKPSVTARKGAEAYPDEALMVQSTTESKIYEKNAVTNINSKFSISNDSVPSINETSSYAVPTSTSSLLSNVTISPQLSTTISEAQKNISSSSSNATQSHTKPMEATDSSEYIDFSEETEGNMVPIVVGSLLILVLTSTVAFIGYKRLKEVWAKRHYARMDFLVDGMYDM